MSTLISLDWRHGLVEPGLAPEPSGGARLVLGHGADEVVLRLSWDSLDALTLKCLTLDRENPHAQDAE
jgi:hypothetical protein